MFGNKNIKLTGIDNTKKLEDSLKNLSKLQVYVGIPEDEAERDDDKEKINNAQLAFIHTHGVRRFSMIRRMQPDLDSGKGYSTALSLYIESYGSPLYRIPARPIIEPAIEAPDNKAKIAADMKEAGESALNGDKQKAMEALKIAGMDAQNIVRDWFEDVRNQWPGNAPATVEKKGSNAPLIDKGEMRKSITYVIATE